MQAVSATPPPQNPTSPPPQPFAQYSLRDLLFVVRFVQTRWDRIFPEKSELKPPRENGVYRQIEQQKTW